MKTKFFLFSLSLLFALGSCTPWQPWEPYSPKGGKWGVKNGKSYKGIYGHRQTGHGSQAHKIGAKPAKPSHMLPFFGK